MAAAEQAGLKDKLAAEVWLAHLIKRDRAFLFANPQHGLDKKTEQEFLSGVQALIEGKPLSQLTGIKEFYGLEFQVTEDVLIPRPESELLVDLVVDFLKSHSYGGKLNIADIGTGSGCILLAVLKTLGFGQGFGVEISERALVVAQKNADRLHLRERVTWSKGGLLEPLPENVDIIMANLPYIGREKFNFIAANVARYEPEEALFGGSDGLDLYREMFRQLQQKKWRPDLLVGEFGFGQQQEMEKILADNFAEAEFQVREDLAGIPRVFVVKWSGRKMNNGKIL